MRRVVVKNDLYLFVVVMVSGIALGWLLNLWAEHRSPSGRQFRRNFMVMCMAMGVVAVTGMLDILTVIGVIHGELAHFATHKSGLIVACSLLLGLAFRAPFRRGNRK